MRNSYSKIVLFLSAIITLVVLTASNFSRGEDNLHITFRQLTTSAKTQVECLAENIYHEARTESDTGKLAVALVTMNRVTNEKFPKSICGVVKQRTQTEGRTICQFSWTCMRVALNKNSDDYEQILKIALHVYANYENLEDITKGSLYYHADYVHPGWKLNKTVTIGRHIFYKEGGTDYATETKFATKGRVIKTFVLPSDGGNKFSKL